MHRKTQHGKKHRENKHLIGHDQWNVTEKMASLKTESHVVSEVESKPKAEPSPIRLPMMSETHLLKSSVMAEKREDKKDDKTRREKFTTQCKKITDRIRDFFKPIF